MKKGRIVALLTDFGTSDPYVGVMKGVILDIAPDTKIVDITHEVTPQFVDQAAYLLWSSYKYFPKGTIFVCVVDPGVGAARKILCVQIDDYIFLAPDNGLLKFILLLSKKQKTIEVRNRRYWRHELSSTFHGRDIFAPVAAHLATGTDISLVGKPDLRERRGESFVKVDAGKTGRYSGRILHIDRFGNIVTNFMPRNLGKNMVIAIGSRKVKTQARSYSVGKRNQPVTILGSSRLLEVSVKNGSAADLLCAHVSQEISLTVV